MNKHLIFKFPYHPNGNLQVLTSDGQDLTDYFRINSLDHAECKPQEFTKIQITMIAALGGKMD